MKPWTPTYAVARRLMDAQTTRQQQQVLQLVPGVDVVAFGSTFVLENRTDDPVDPVPGRMWYRTDL